MPVTGPFGVARKVERGRNVRASIRAIVPSSSPIASSRPSWRSEKRGPSALSGIANGRPIRWLPARSQITTLLSSPLEYRVAPSSENSSPETWPE